MVRLYAALIGATQLLGAITFDELPIVTRDKPFETEVHGYAYRNSAGNWILAKQPNLRTCCVGAAANVMQQIYLDDSHLDLEPNSAVHLVGTLSISPAYSEQGELISYYHLGHAKKNPAKFPWLTLSLAALAMIGGYFGFKKISIMMEKNTL